jgi:multidrug efflux system membrane fusion protein
MADFPDPPPRNLDEAVDAQRRGDEPLDALLEPAPRDRRLTWIIIALLVLIAGGAAYWYFYMGSPDQPAADTAAEGKGKGKGKGKGGANSGRPVPILAAPARTADIPVYLTGLGTVTPLATVTVRSRVDGQLLRVLFQEGQFVKSGQLLAEIDPRPFQVQLTQAEGQLAKDQALLRNAVIDLDRYKTLFAQDSIAKQQLDTQASLVRQYEAQIKADQGTVESAKLQLTYSRVTAPIAGRIGLRQVDPGNIIRAGDVNGIVVITQLQPVSVIFTLPEDVVAGVMRRLTSGEKLPVEGWDRADKAKLANGMLMTVDNQIDPTTGTVKLRARFSNDDFSLFPNQFVNARMLVDTLRDVTVVPTAAVQRGNQGTFVYVVKEDNTVTVRPLKLGPSQGEIVAVESGIKPGESIVTDGADRLREGARVEVADRSPRPDKGGGRRGGGKGRGGGDAAGAPGKGGGGGDAAAAPGKGGGGGDAAGAPGKGGGEGGKSGGESAASGGAGKSGGESAAPPGAAKGDTTKREGAAAPAGPPPMDGKAPGERGKGESRGKREGETDAEREKRRAEWRSKSDAEKAEWRKKREAQQQ